MKKNKPSESLMIVLTAISRLSEGASSLPMFFDFDLVFKTAEEKVIFLK